MNDLQNLHNTLDILNKQEEMLDLLEKQQSEIEFLKKENLSLEERLDEMTSLNDQLVNQTKSYAAALKISNAQNETLKKQIKELQNSKS